MYVNLCTEDVQLFPASENYIRLCTYILRSHKFNYSVEYFQYDI